MKNEEILSVSQWEEMAVADLTNFLARYEFTLTSGTLKSCKAFDDEIESWVKGKDEGVMLEAALDMVNGYAAQMSTNTFSLPVAEALHVEVGGVVSRALIGLLMPSAAGCGIRIRAYDAYERLLLIRLAVRIYDHQHGHLPETLETLVDDGLLDNDMIVDPMSGKTFLVKRYDASFTAYSVGSDLDDDGGRAVQLDSDRDDRGDTILVPLGMK
jgi:hypothetical protein